MKGNRFRFLALFFGGLALVASLFALYRLLNKSEGTAWTPKSMALRLDSVADRFEVYVAGDPLDRKLSEGRLTLAGKDPFPRALTAWDVTVRVNNHDQVRLAQMPTLMWLAAAAGASAILFLIGVFAPASLGAGSSGITELHLLHET